jgi:hypothetical protein
MNNKNIEPFFIKKVRHAIVLAKNLILWESYKGFQRLKIFINSLC